MKKRTLLSIIILTIMGMLKSSSVFSMDHLNLFETGLQNSNPESKLIDPTHVYVPTGFDTNDTTEVIISGILPNLCYKYPETKVKIHGKTISVELTSLYHQPTPYCAQVLVPFTERVKIGVLSQKGDYKIIVNHKSAGRKVAQLKISEPQSDAIDDHVYANVSFIETKEEWGRKVLLKGYNPGQCFELDQVKIISNNKDTYSILPIMKKITEYCPLKMIPFASEVQIPEDLKEQDVLLHVRSLEGKSINQVLSE